MSQLSLQSNTPEPLKETLFVQVLLPLPLPKTFTYRVPDKQAEKVQHGVRVIVPFGKKKIITGVIKEITNQAPADYEARYLFEVLDDYPMIMPQQFKLFEWIASYYMATEGETFNVGIPSGLKLSSESKLQLHPQFNRDDSPYIFSNLEDIVINLLKKEGLLSYQQIAELASTKEISLLIKELLRKQVILLIEQVKEKYKPKTEKYVKLNKSYLQKDKLEQLMELLEKKPRQLDILLKYLQQVPVFQDAELNENGFAKAQFANSGLSDSSVNTLIKNDILEVFDKEISRLDIDSNHQYTADINLTDFQEEAKSSLEEQFAKHDVNLLQGVTGSGKTEIYLSFIKEVIDSGSQALFLLPEIAITTQMIQRVRKIFGKQVGVYHSKFSDAERVEIYRGVAEGSINFIIGVRSSIFLPFNNLSFIVVDEEHEQSYKQFDPAPRYHARDAAIVLGKIHQAKVLLGSATPSLESYFNAKNNKYGYYELTQRYKEVKLPHIEIINMKKEKAKKQTNGDYSHSLIEQLKVEVEKKKQAIIFQNRRGYAPYIQCETCGWIAECENCSVSLTYHMHQHQLKCHYCGFRQKSPAVCLNCESSNLQMKGFGTEKIEDDLHLMFPEVKIQRMDKDTTRKKYSYQQIIEAFENNETQLLVGTQMVSKGLDFKNVSLVAIVDADRMMFYPDFRAHERAFQMMLQVSGRAGRDKEQGQVFVQTYQHDNPLFYYLKNYDIKGFYEKQLEERYQFAYPPFYRLIKVILKSKEAVQTQKSAQLMYNGLTQIFGTKRVLAPHEPVIAKIKNIFHQEIWIKLEKGHPLDQAKQKISEVTNKLKEDKQFNKVRIYFDVDPA
ncbi:primosomal protein N' [Marivirga atlantica]|uniref:Replication restart protein PriA n=1 Tax=Marivirga atlantica TaxID=1548457 RepID=A0A937DH62_9BACT|nr:primosomal protein N' [Marivirga atlantica]MBL0765558.1 primosomal protein N' [Marivirga atlantica]